MAKITGTVKWFSNRKGFGFLAPTSDNAPTKDEIFVHHSSLQMVEGAYRTLVEGASVEFEVETDSNGKLKAVNVTNVGGSPLSPPSREKRRKRKPKTEEGEGGKSSDEKEAEVKKPNGGRGEPKGGKKKGGTKPQPPKREPPFHQVIPEDLKSKISAKGLKLVRYTVDLALGNSRIKLGQGGYASLVDAKGLIGEGSYACDETAKVSFTWERCLEFADGKWNLGDATKLIPSISLVDDAVSPVKADETPESLWGADKPDPKDLFEANGFKMKKVILTRPRSIRGRQGGSRND